jgi:site-specific DNA-methyltransferase (adenine-specific)
MNANHKIMEGDLLSLLPTLPDNHFDAVLCDPPYHLTAKSRNGSLQPAKGFMGNSWDGGDIAFRPETWEAVMRVMKPGAYLMAFGGSRTFHRMAVAMEDAGFILVDTLMWVYGNGFPKSTNISKAIDRNMGNKRETTGIRKHPTLKNTDLLEESANAAHGGNSWRREWEITAPACPESEAFAGYGTALKPAYEPILLCRKPGEKTYAENALKWGCGALNIDGGRIPTDGETLSGGAGRKLSHIRDGKPDPGVANNGYVPSPVGRWPANVMFDEAAAEVLDAQSGIRKSGAHRAGLPRITGNTNVYGKASGVDSRRVIHASEGGASRFFYVSKVSTKERQAGVSESNDHPTMKPIDLTKQLATLLLPPVRTDGQPRRLLVPFSGSGSEMIGALLAGWDDVTGIEQSEDYAGIARERLAWWAGENLMRIAQ